ncbi:MAG TPA: DNA-processing protein DprA, partial [Candidatus Ozemobacteraceae bacterium]|nr:DNA-processing protein DprA [Candidatus Ozemobacteraceae bacterium]
ICVVSGGARGIDAAAHRACLEQGGQTIAVIATGIDIAYPPEHAELFREISRTGCVLSEFFPGTPPVASHFPTRNRIIAGLAQAVVFIEGNARSGGLITVRKSLQAKRPVWAARHPDLLDGARPPLERLLSPGRFFSSPGELFELLAPLFPLGRHPPPRSEPDRVPREEA